MLSFLFESPGRPDVPGPSGLKPTLRQGMIVVLWSALLVAAVRAMISWGLFVGPPEVLIMSIATMISVWPPMLLCLLLIVFDRRGPVGRWHVDLRQIGCSYLGIASFLLLEPACLAWAGRTSMIFPLFTILGLFGAWTNTMHLRSIWPKRCDRCGSLAVIATGSFPDRFGPIGGPRSSAGGAACGTMFEKGHATVWQPSTPSIPPPSVGHPDGPRP